jgi:hypothetical protein
VSVCALLCDQDLSGNNELQSYPPTLNPLVEGSNPSRPTKKDKGLGESLALFSLPRRTHGALTDNN